MSAVNVCRKSRLHACVCVSARLSGFEGIYISPHQSDVIYLFRCRIGAAHAIRILRTRMVRQRHVRYIQVFIIVYYYVDAVLSSTSLPFLHFPCIQEHQRLFTIKNKYS